MLEDLAICVSASFRFFNILETFMSYVSGNCFFFTDEYSFPLITTTLKMKSEIYVGKRDLSRLFLFVLLELAI